MLVLNIVPNSTNSTKYGTKYSSMVLNTKFN